MDDAGTPVDADAALLQIGDLCERVGLSQRTVRYYEEVGLVVPTTRSRGGFRLYAPDSIKRFSIIKQMKPLGFSLEDMAAVLGALDDAAHTDAESPDAPALLDRLRMHQEAVAFRRASLEEQLAAADRLAKMIAETGDRLTADPQTSSE